MNKLISGLLLTASFLTASAEYTTLDFKTTGGETKSIEAKGLTITIEGDNLLITNMSGEKLTLPAASLSYMQFANLDSGAVKQLFSNSTVVEAYELNGVFAGKFESLEQARAALSDGVYILRNSERKSIKVIVKK